MPQESMSSHIKNWVGYALTFALVLMGASSLWYVHAYSRATEPSSFRSFVVSADGRAIVIPDIAAFTFEVITEGGKNLVDSQTENTKKTNGAISFVKSKGVEAKDIKTQNYNVEPRYQYFNCTSAPVIYQVDGQGAGGSVSQGVPSRACPPAEIVGYTVRQVVSVKVRKFDAVGDVLSGVVENGANSVSQLSFTVDDPTAVENEARTEALVKAKAKAKAMANAGGFRLGRLLNISEGGDPYYYDKRLYASESYGMGGDAVSAPSPTVEPGSQEFQIIMTITYEMR